MKIPKVPYLIAIDGPAGSGKGTIAKLISKKIDLNYLDSGSIYRVIALSAIIKNIPSDQVLKLTSLVESINMKFEGDDVLLDKKIITDKIRTSEISKFSSEIAVHPELRDKILNLQRSFYRGNGLVAEGRDMTTVVFPNADLKVYLDASPHERANRRYKQLILKGNNVNIQDLTSEIEARDKRDMERKASPLKIADEAKILNTDDLTIGQTVDKILKFIT
jgi:cytidylate kinase|tara:strand:+ start:6065 stop:6724 length:660 start_codon:yes stop_codon:yes gene_type:complete